MHFSKIQGLKLCSNSNKHTVLLLFHLETLHKNRFYHSNIPYISNLSNKNNLCRYSNFLQIKSSLHIDLFARSKYTFNTENIVGIF